MECDEWELGGECMCTVRGRRVDCEGCKQKDALLGGGVRRGGCT